MGATDASRERSDVPAVNVGLLGAPGPGRDALRCGLLDHGLSIALEADLATFVANPDAGEVQVILVDLHHAADEELEQLADLMALQGLPPLLFNEDSPAERENVWMRRLAGKLAGLAGPAAEPDTPAPVQPAASPDIWVLGASFGGPEAVKRFLEAVPEVPEAVFVLVQHIGDGFVDLLAAQLNRSTPFRVLPLMSGAELRPGCVYVMPVDRVLELDADDRVVLAAETAADRSYNPCIDEVMRRLSHRFGPRVGAVVFSGMGDDGTAGAEAIAEAGGEVWAQDSGSCSISSMPDCAAATGVVSRRGNPEELARALVQYLRAPREQA
ncbi:chemotaxis protein CheB [Aquisalimonas sp. 2447]|uniref:chemotaxis protein CheB n=1 Tax=Aquisalimonas sp. 2447 TaxID=2740807 RepID=UPI0014323B7D|nr:chemotaxis protein CheB [Aquisalimonas sp. 2447]QIT54199.1 chemotaxis protein CheB [Aquisalimonas sp. 2447]